MIIQIGAEIRIKDPTPQLKKWCDENLVIRNPEYDDRMQPGTLSRKDAGIPVAVPGRWSGSGGSDRDRKGDPEVFNGAGSD